MPSLKNKMITACNRFSRRYLRHLLNRKVVDRLYCLAIVVRNIYFFTSCQSPRSSILIHLRKLRKLTLMKMRVNPSTRFNISFFWFSPPLQGTDFEDVYLRNLLKLSKQLFSRTLLNWCFFPKHRRSWKNTVKAYIVSLLYSPHMGKIISKGALWNQPNF